jgi:phosphohistidine phosphatase
MMVNIYFIRHGDSEKTSVHKKDSDRELTAQGRNITRSAALQWKKIIPDFDYIITSPYLRAVQTADIIASAFNHNNGIITDKKLAPGSKTADLIEIVHTYSGKNIAIVGHQPDLAEHISSLISNSQAYIEFKKSSIAKLSFGSKVKEGKGTLDFLIPPEIIIT